MSYHELWRKWDGVRRLFSSCFIVNKHKIIILYRILDPKIDLKKVAAETQEILKLFLSFEQNETLENTEQLAKT